MAVVQQATHAKSFTVASGAEEKAALTDTQEFIEIVNPDASAILYFTYTERADIDLSLDESKITSDEITDATSAGDECLAVLPASTTVIPARGTQFLGSFIIAGSPTITIQTF